MSEPTLLRGEPLATEIRASVRDDLETLTDRGVDPVLGTVLASDDDGAIRFMDRKHERCADFGIGTERIDLSPDEPAEAVYAAVDQLARDDRVTGVFVQVPLPNHVDEVAVRDRVPPEKDVDCFAHENLGRLVGGDPRVLPPTTAAVRRLLEAYDVSTAGRDVVVVGRSLAIGRPLANLLLHRGPSGDATVTVCHTATRDLGAETRRADILVTAAGTPGLVDGSMVSPGVRVVDVSVNRIEGPDGDSVLVGDVDHDTVAPKSAAITPVPGGVGPLTLALVLRNTVDLAARSAGVSLDG